VLPIFSYYICCKGRALTDLETKQLIAAACYMHIEREDAASSFLDNDR